jgi:hypothetical protein
MHDDEAPKPKGGNGKRDKQKKQTCTAAAAASSATAYGRAPQLTVHQNMMCHDTVVQTLRALDAAHNYQGIINLKAQASEVAAAISQASAYLYSLLASCHDELEQYPEAIVMYEQAKDMLDAEIRR